MGNRVLQEIAPLGENDFMYVADRHKQEFDYPIHRHEIFELNFVANAVGCRRIVGDSTEVIGDLDLVLITSPELEHVWEQNKCKSDDIHEITIQFRADFDSPNSIYQTNPFFSIRQMLSRAKRGLSFPRETILLVLDSLLNLSSIKDGFQAVKEFFTILNTLSKCDNAKELASSAFAKVAVDSKSKRILTVKNYIDVHYREDISLEEVADLIGMAPAAFSRFFKLHTGKTISEYIVDIRLGHAARLLVDTTDTISEICWATGFNTLSHFNRLFRKRKQCSPKEFRMKYQKTKVII